jgi:hypothetical protein
MPQGERGASAVGLCRYDSDTLPALIGLRARAVVVLSEDLEERGLGSILEGRDAIVNAWLSPRGLEMQLEAGVVLGEPVILRWGLEGGRWYVLSTSSARR